MNTSKPLSLEREGSKLFIFIDPQGKDCWTNRWRVDLYYAPHLAMTYFLHSEENYTRFLEENKRLVIKRSTS